MKSILKTIGFTCLFGVSHLLNAQNNNDGFPLDGSTFLLQKNTSEKPCITAEQYDLLDKEVRDNLRNLGLEDNHNRNTLLTSFSWPIRNANGLSQCNYHNISSYVDQNTAGTAIQDYNCGTNTYDGHHGTDIAIWPYSFYKMDNNLMEVVAAAPGFIVQKADGNFDRNCAMGSALANSVIISHSDGSIALYWHMKQNSVTTKEVGDWVDTGEYLGVIGSSGSSTGPHLHFEVWTNGSSSSYKDPYSGTCNTLNANSWWLEQRPYAEPGFLKVSVNTSDITFATCPNSDILNESDIFQVPFQGPGLAPGYAKFYLFMREMPVNSVLSMRILNPNGTVFNSWNSTMTTYYKTSYWGFSRLLPTIDGIYTFEASYNGVTCSKTFTITHNLAILDSNNSNDFSVFPNPTADEFVIAANGIANEDYTLYLSNVAGQTLTKEKFSVENNKLEKSFSLYGLANGIYFLTLDNTKSRIVKKIIKK